MKNVKDNTQSRIEQLIEHPQVVVNEVALLHEIRNHFNSTNVDVIGGGFTESYLLEKAKNSELMEAFSQSVKLLRKTSEIGPLGNRDFVIGISGGVDSALASTLSVLATKGDQKVHVVLLHKSRQQEDYKRARHHVEFLKHMKGSQFVEVYDWVHIFNKSFNTQKDILTEYSDANDLAFANLASRIRMGLLYYVANTYKGIVVGTGNYIEDNVTGFFTKYGDGGVDVGPIQRFLKSEVYILSIMLGISPKIINTDPNDGLWEDGRDDKDQIGMSYFEIEQLIETRSMPEFTKILGRYVNNLHKITPIPTIKREVNPIFD